MEMGMNTLPLFDATLTLPSGEVLQLGRFTARYAAIARNWHRAWLGLDEPFEEVPDERWALGKSWTVYSPKPSRRWEELFQSGGMKPERRKGKQMKRVRADVD
jgi:hypothetical protein